MVAQNSQSSNKRIAKNTLMLYVRTIFVMVVSLFTSRVVLQALGVDNYGIYSVVGGVVAMFSLLSGSLSSAISRFITFELGKNDRSRLKTIFCTSVNVQIIMAAIVLIVGEIVGLWFLNTTMNIPEGRQVASNWVFQMSLMTFFINLLCIPYNASIIAHEKMSAFAYVSILEVVLKLVIVYMLYVSPFDKLIAYSVLLAIVQFVICLVYRLYCKRHFEETAYHFIWDKSVLKEIFSFASWNFLSNIGIVFNTQGINILINIFFGVATNAARGIATQVETAVMQFVNNFTVAVNPQITKSFAAGNTQDVYRLVCDGARISFFLMIVLCLPIIMETEQVLSIWLVEIPEHTTNFIRLTFIGSLINAIGLSGATACLATGRIKKYSIIISSVIWFLFPLTWIAYCIGLPIESTYVLFIIVYAIADIVRLFLMRGLIGFPVMLFFTEVIQKMIIITIASVIVPLIIVYYLPQSYFRLFLSIFSSLFCTTIFIYFLGLKSNEKVFFKEKINSFLVPILK